MTTHPRTLDAYPCGNQDIKCRKWCRDMVDAGTAGCHVLPIYRQAIADHRCARLLRIFEQWCAFIIELRLDEHMIRMREKIGFTAQYKSAKKQALRFKRIDRYIRDALRGAGLE